MALAAQKPLENVFAAATLAGDRPVKVGDFCRFGDRVGTVLEIGLRSTRVRTLDRTVVTIPNADFSSLELENFSPRDKIWFHVLAWLHPGAEVQQEHLSDRDHDPQQAPAARLGRN